MNTLSRVFLSLFSAFFVCSVSAFSDISPEDPDRHAFEHLRDVGIVRNFPGGAFAPANMVTKAEALAFALRAGGIAIPAEFSQEFLPNDVDPNSWQASVVARARELKISNLNSQEFFPNAIVSKAEYLAFLFRATKVNFDPFFSKTAIISADVPPESWFAPHFRYAQKYGIANRSADDLYYPFQGLSKRDIAKITFRQLRIFHGDAATKKFIEMQAHINQFIDFVQKDESEKATFHLQKILILSREITLQKNDETAIAAMALSKSLKNLVASLQSIKYGNRLKAVESLLLASNYAERAEQKSDIIAPVAKEIAFIIDETLNNFVSQRYTYAY